MIQKISIYEIQNTLCGLEKHELPINNQKYAEQVKIQLIASFLYPLRDQWEGGKIIDYTNGDTLLHWASRSKFWNVSSYLVGQGENPLKVNENGKTAVDLAREISGDMKENIFRISKHQLTPQLNSQNINKTAEHPNTESQEIKELLETLIKTNDKLIFEELAKKITSDQIRTYLKFAGKHFSPIHEAARINNGRFIAWALNKGLASSDSVDADGNTFAHILASQANDQGPYLPQISYLFNKMNNAGKTVLHLLGKNNCVHVLKNTHGIEHIISNSSNNIDRNGNNYYHDAAEAGATEFLQFIWETLTEKKAKEIKLKQKQLGFSDYKVNYREISCFNQTNHQKQNILHLAYKADQMNVVNYLLTLPGLEPLLEQEDSFGKTPLSYART